MTHASMSMWWDGHAWHPGPQTTWHWGTPRDAQLQALQASLQALEARLAAIELKDARSPVHHFEGLIRGLTAHLRGQGPSGYSRSTRARGQSATAPWRSP